MLNDLMMGARLFRRHMVLASAAVVSLALGIGANTAIFSVLHNVVLNALRYADPDRLVIVWETRAEDPERWVAPANFIDWRRETRSFVSLAAFDEFAPTLSGSGEPERLRALGVSGNFFTTLGAAPLIGRTLLASDDAADAASVAVLSEGSWARLFSTSSDVIGRSVTLDGRQYTIVGVMPSTFESPLQSGAIDIWLSGDQGVPRTFPFAGDLTAVRDSHTIFVVGRLREGATRSAAQQELTALMQRLAERYPSTNAGLGVNVVPLHEAIVGDIRPLLVLLQLAVGMMLLIACANVAHLLLGQATGREGEVAMRAALGARRSRIVRQLLAETLVIAIPGGVLGLALAVWGLDALIALAPANLPRLHSIGIDATVLGFTMAVTLGTALVFGLGPAFQLSRPTSLQVLSARTTSSRAVRRWHDAIVIAELALAEMLLVGAGLLLASFIQAQRIDLGFQTEGRVAVDLSLAPDRYLQPVAAGSFQIDPARKIQFVDDVLMHLRATPGVRAAAAAFTSPLTGAPNRGISIAGRPRKGPGQEESADFQLITPDFFRAAGVTLERGRPLNDSDRADSPPVAIVNRSFADRFFPGEDPIGQRVQFGATMSHEIVGVVGDMRYRFLESAPDPTFYVPLTQNSERWPFLSFTIWADGEPSRFAPVLRAAIGRADPAQAITRIRTYDEVVSIALGPRRFNTMLIAIFAGAALLLAGVGTYGVMAYAVMARTREIGVRAALGATPGALLLLIVGRGATLTIVAVAAGLSGSLAATRLLSAMLYEVRPRDPITFSGVALLITIVALVASWVPARKAVQINPVGALREQ